MADIQSCFVFLLLYANVSAIQEHVFPIYCVSYEYKANGNLCWYIGCMYVQLTREMAHLRLVKIGKICYTL